MCGLEHSEVATVDCQDRRDIQSFRHRNDAGVHEVYILIVVFAEDLSGSTVIIDLWSDQLVGEGVDRLKKLSHRMHPEAVRDKESNLRYDGDR